MTFAITLQNAHVDLPLRQRSIENLLRRAGVRSSDGGRVQSGRVGPYVKVLNDVTLRVPHGTRLGLIGVNGAGKSSLLRLMAGIYTPTQGTCEVDGRVSTLFSSTIGMNPQASGRENIYVSGRTLGLTKAEIEAVTPEIIDFADLGEFIDLPLRVYSNGMKTRLGFGIATSISPNILLIDEVFGAGDTGFRNRATQRISRVMGEAATLVLATHSIGILREFCESVCWIDQGKVKFTGDINEGLERYKDDKADC